MNAPVARRRDWQRCVRRRMPRLPARCARAALAAQRSRRCGRSTRTRSPGSSRRRSRRSLAPAAAARRPGIQRRSGLAFQADCGLAAAASPSAPPQQSCGALQAGALDRAAAWSACRRPAGAARRRRGARARGDRRGPAAARRRADAVLAALAATPNVPRGSAATSRRSCATCALPGDAATTSTTRAWARSTRRTRGSSPARRRAGRSTRESGVFTASWTHDAARAAARGAADAVSEVWLGRRQYPGGLPADADGRARRAPHGRPRGRARAAGRGARHASSSTPRRAARSRGSVAVDAALRGPHRRRPGHRLDAARLSDALARMGAARRRRLGPRLAAGARGRDRRGAAVRRRPGARADLARESRASRGPGRSAS